MEPLESNLQCPPLCKCPTQGFQLPLSPRSPQRTTVVDTRCVAASATQFVCPRCIRKNSHCHMPAPAEGSCRSHPRSTLLPQGTSLSTRSNFSHSWDAGSVPHLTLDLVQWENVFLPTEALSFTFSFQLPWFFIFTSARLYEALPLARVPMARNSNCRTGSEKRRKPVISQTILRDVHHRRVIESHTS